MLREELRHISSSPADLKKFGLTIGMVMYVFGIYFFIKNNQWYVDAVVVGTVLVTLGVFFPQTLKGLERVWMAIAIVLGWVVSRVILAIIYYLVVTPIGMLSKLFGKHFLELRIDKQATTYWRKRGTSSGTNSHPHRYENQF